MTNFALSPSFGYSSFKNESVSFSESSSSFNLGGRLTYMIPIAKKLYIPTFVDYGYNFNSNGDNRFLIVSNTSVFSFGAGFEYLVAQRLGLRFSLRNSFTRTLDFDLTDYSLNGFIGFSLYFQKKETE